jgi:hypothetical protein
VELARVPTFNGRERISGEIHYMLHGVALLSK